MTSNNIWMDSGAMVSMIPEMDLYLGAFTSIDANTASGNENDRVITLNSTFTTNFSLVTNLYRGCYLRIHAVSGNALIDRVMIQSNAAGTITVNNSLASAITPSNSAVADASAHYGVIEHQGAPVPAPKGASAGNVYTAQVLNIQFKSDTASDYEDVGIIFGTLQSAGGTEDDVGIFLTTDGTYGNAGSLAGQTEDDITVNIGNSELTTAEEYIDAVIAAVGLKAGINFTATRSGDSLILTNEFGGAVARTAGCDDGGSDSTIASLDLKSASTIELTTTTTGATTASTNPRLLSDTWLGLTSAVTIPSTSIETKGIPISTGSRSMVYQFKGSETTSGGSFSVSANHFGWLYYALGKKTASLASGGTPTVSSTFATSGLSDTAFILDTGVTSAGFHRVEDNKICPPLNPQLGQDTTGVQSVSDTLTNKITYAFSESNNEDLPTFALEYTLKKPESQLTVAVDSSTETVYSKIYPGCVVSSLTLDASANQEVNMNVNFETKKTFVAPTNYDTANNVTDAKNFVNFGSPRGGTANQNDTALLPFFFSDGTISMFGQDYIRIETMSLSIENSLTPKRFIGAYDKTSQFHLPGQRTYRLSFTGLVTDAAVFDALRRTEAYSLNGTSGNELTLRFTKEAGSTDELLEMKFEDYMVTTADFPLTNDNGPISVSWEIQPLKLKSCSHITNWVIQG